MTVLNKKSFKLPRMDKEKFVHLMHLGLDYNREQGIFSIKSYNNIESVLENITTLLGTEVVFMQNCERCGKDFACGACNYEDQCTTKNLPFNCICSQCLKG